MLEDELIPKVIGLGERVRRRELLGNGSESPLAKPVPNALPLTKPAAPVQPMATMTPKTSPPLGAAPPVLAAPAKAVVIGVSTGGPMALMQIFGELTQPLHVPVFIVQHMPPTFTTLLAARLTATSEMTIREPEGGEVVELSLIHI